VNVLRDCVHDIPFRFASGLPVAAQRQPSIYSTSPMLSYPTPKTCA
jgi:hypothetical protein